MVKSPPLTGVPPVLSAPVARGVAGVAAAAAADDELDELVVALLAAAALVLELLDPELEEVVDVLPLALLLPQASKTRPIADSDKPAAKPRLMMSRRDIRRSDASPINLIARRSSEAIDPLRFVLREFHWQATNCKDRYRCWQSKPASDHQF